MKQVVRIQRGLPGSGKSTRALMALATADGRGQSAIICSADGFFTKPDGTYHFQGSKLGEAHKQCFKEFVDALFMGFDIVIVDNTNIKLEEFEQYMKVAVIAGREIHIDGRRPKDDAELLMWHNRCVHDVPFDRVKARAQQWEDIPESWKHSVVYV